MENHVDYFTFYPTYEKLAKSTTYNLSKSQKISIKKELTLPVIHKIRINKNLLLIKKLNIKD